MAGSTALGHDGGSPAASWAASLPPLPLMVAIHLLGVSSVPSLKVADSTNSRPRNSDLEDS